MYAEHLKPFIPPEFDLTKYESAATLDLWDWAANLGKRCGLRCDLLEEELTLENIQHGRLAGVEGPVATSRGPAGGVQDVIHDLVSPLGGHHFDFDLV